MPSTPDALRSFPLPSCPLTTHPRRAPPLCRTIDGEQVIGLFAKRNITMYQLVKIYSKRIAMLCAMRVTHTIQ